MEKNLLIVGTVEFARQFIDHMHRHEELGYQMIGLVDLEELHVSEYVNGVEVLGTSERFLDIVHEHVVDEVAILCPCPWNEAIGKVIFLCENEGINVNLSSDLIEPKLSPIQQADLGGIPMLNFQMTPEKWWVLAMKRFMDITLSMAALMLGTPILVAIMFLIKVSSPGPVFFIQERSGLHGRRFNLFKFRTMIPQAELKLKELMNCNEMTGPVFKMGNDPRITKVGKFLRKFSMDELPQFWNVLRGDMSLVGPRPPIPAEVNLYDPWQRRRLSVKPGITCLWQVNGRNKITDFKEWVKLDLQYIDHWSLWLEFKILFKTIPAVLSGAGAK